jgi:hypothetical protein
LGFLLVSPCFSGSDTYLGYRYVAKISGINDKSHSIKVKIGYNFGKIFVFTGRWMKSPPCGGGWLVEVRFLVVSCKRAGLHGNPGTDKAWQTALGFWGDGY